MAESLPPILSSLPEAALADVMARAEFVESDYGAVLAREDVLGDVTAVVLEGEVALEVGGQDVCSLGADEVVGALSAVGDPVRHFTARVTRTATLMTLDAAALEALRRSGNPIVPALQRRSLATLSRLLWSLDGALLARLPSFDPDYPEDPLPLHKRIARMLGLATEPPLEVDATSVLHDSGLFDAPPEILAALASRFTAHRGGSGHLLFTQGEPSQVVGFLVSGAIDVIAVTGPEQFERLGGVGAGELFGLTSPLQHRRHRASCVTVEPSVWLELPDSEFEAWVAQDGPEGDAVRRAATRALGRVVVRAHDQLAEVQAEAAARAHADVSDLR